jgi:NTP pyrophosphatase (non-canonical NTP hydrolase)
MVSELADVANYTFMLAEVLGVDLHQAMLAKLIEVEQRPQWKARR